MKLRFIYVLLFSAFALIVLQSKKNGPAAQGIGDNTGSPLSGGGNCGNCHGGAFNNTGLVVRVKNSGGTIVTSYDAGVTYTIEFAVTSSSSFTYGFQGVVLKSGNLQAGTFGTPITSNTQVTTFSGRQYAEHSAPMVAGGGFTFKVPWTAPVSGTGTVTIYSDAVTVNGDNSTNGDDPAGPVTLVLPENASATIDYPQPTYCNTGNDPTPSILGTPGGTFSATPSGLSINATTGTIDVSASTVNQTYTITYTFAGGTATDVVTISPLDDASFSYNQNSYCFAAIDPTPTITGLAGGTFSAVPAGLVINTSTGVIDLSASTLGTYTVVYETNGFCQNIGTFPVTVTNMDNAGFTYGNSSYCLNGIDPTPTTITGNGMFSSTAGLSISASTGVIDLSASTPATYTITYTTSGACSNSSNQVVTINAMDNASFNYGLATYCQNVPNPTPTITGLPNGFFSSSPAGLNINTFTGLIDISASTLGSYTVTYTTNGSCPNSSNQPITIAAVDNASFTYGGANFCQNGGNKTPTFSTAGTWSASPAGLSINSTTGVINAAASTAGIYTVTHTTTGVCPSSTNQSITILATDNASFTYGGSSFCQNGTDPTPTFSTSGTWSATPSGLSINSSTGMIDVSASTVGSYTIVYTTTGSCPSSSNQVVAITAADNASFTYGGASFCQNGIDRTPTFSTAGTWSATPAGLSINSSTGVIDVSASTVGSYTITHTTTGPCPSSSNQVVAITTADNASFTYGGATFCQNGSDPTPTFSTAGTWSATPSGLSINSSTGLIDVSASTAASYTITHTTTGSCPNSSTQSLTIVATDDASFSYNNSSYCQNGVDPTPTFATTGTWSATPAGLSINSSTGIIDVSASAAGSYTITHTTTGTCPNSANQVLVITATDNASFTYGGSSFCQSGTDPIPTFSATGTWSSTPAGLSINSSTGVIDVSASTVGGYAVTFTTNGTCPSSSLQSISITSTGSSAFSYASVSYCTNNTDPTPTISGNPGGVFASTAGLAINASTGLIDVSASTVGSYLISYSVGGACPSSSNFNISIALADDASFSYNNSSYCQNEIDPQPTITGTTGSFSSSAGLSIDTNTGLIDLSTSVAGTYNVTYTTNGSCPNSSVVVITVTPTDNAGFTYGGSTFCQNGTDPIPTIVSSGGLFTSTPSGLVVNSSTGEIDVSASSTGTYNLIYTTNGVCLDSMLLVVTITANGDASFSYMDTVYCQSNPNEVPIITGNPGGGFSAGAGLIINSSTGELNFLNSTVGSYIVTYTIGGVCPSSSDVSLQVLGPDVVSLGFTDTTFCLNLGFNPILPVTSPSGGTFWSSSSGLVFADVNTGEVDLMASALGGYLITYTTNGACPVTVVANVGLTICGGVEVVTTQDLYQLFPNPNEGIFTIKNNSTSGTTKIVLRDVLGQLIVFKEIYLNSKEHYEMYLPQLTKGLYFVEMQNGMNYQTIKMIVSE